MKNDDYSQSFLREICLNPGICFLEGGISIEINVLEVSCNFNVALNIFNENLSGGENITDIIKRTKEYIKTAEGLIESENIRRI